MYAGFLTGKLNYHQATKPPKKDKITRSGYAQVDWACDGRSPNSDYLQLLLLFLNAVANFAEQGRKLPMTRHSMSPK